jgi:hypothetical protein
MNVSEARVSRMEHGDVEKMRVESIAAYVTTTAFIDYTDTLTAQAATGPVGESRISPRLWPTCPFPEPAVSFGSDTLNDMQSVGRAPCIKRGIHKRISVHTWPEILGVERLRRPARGAVRSRGRSGSDHPL